MKTFIDNSDFFFFFFFFFFKDYFSYFLEQNIGATQKL